MRDDITKHIYFNTNIHFPKITDQFNAMDSLGVKQMGNAMPILTTVETLSVLLLSMGKI